MGYGRSPGAVGDACAGATDRVGRRKQHAQGQPSLDWTEEQVWQYIRARKLPYNSLHDRQFPSIGCSPCTRAIQPGENRRAGRWWWEQPESRECGLHPRVRHAAAQA